MPFYPVFPPIARKNMCLGIEKAPRPDVMGAGGRGLCYTRVSANGNYAVAAYSWGRLSFSWRKASSSCSMVMSQPGR